MCSPLSQLNDIRDSPFSSDGKNLLLNVDEDELIEIINNANEFANCENFAGKREMKNQRNPFFPQTMSTEPTPGSTECGSTRHSHCISASRGMESVSTMSGINSVSSDRSSGSDDAPDGPATRRACEGDTKASFGKYLKSPVESEKSLDHIDFTDEMVVLSEDDLDFIKEMELETEDLPNNSDDKSAKKPSITPAFRKSDSTSTYEGESSVSLSAANKKRERPEYFSPFQEELGALLQQNKKARIENEKSDGTLKRCDEDEDFEDEFQEEHLQPEIVPQVAPEFSEVVSEVFKLEKSIPAGAEPYIPTPIEALFWSDANSSRNTIPQTEMTVTCPKQKKQLRVAAQDSFKLSSPAHGKDVKVPYAPRKKFLDPVPAVGEGVLFKFLIGRSDKVGA